MTEPVQRSGALEPVHLALLDDARAEARRILDEARVEAEELVRRAEQETDAEIDKARRRKERAAEAAAAQALGRASTEAHSAVLAAQCDVRRQLIAEARAAADGMRHDPRYPRLLDHFAAIARDQLGPLAAVESDPETGGGVTATDGPRRVDYTLPALVDRAMELIGDEVATLWV